MNTTDRIATALDSVQEVCDLIGVRSAHDRIIGALIMLNPEAVIEAVQAVEHSERFR